MNRTSVQGILAFLIMSAAVLLNVGVTLGNDNQQQSEPVVQASSGPNGRIQPSGHILVGWGTSQTFRMTPVPGYHVEDVLVNGISVGAVTRYTFGDLYEDAYISVTFAQNTTDIYASAHGPGSINPRGSVAVPVGADQVFTMLPLPGAVVVDVQVNGTSVGAVTSYTFQNVRRPNNSIRVIFGWAPSTITASATRNGTIVPTGRVVMPPNGGDQMFVIVPAEHCHIGDVLVDGMSVGAVAQYRFVDVLGQHTIRSVFELDTYPIAADEHGKGSISPSGMVNVGHGSAVAFTMTAEDGYHVADVLVDGESVGAVSTYTFEDVAAPHAISARFAVDGTWQITLSPGVGGSIEPAGTQTGSLAVMNGNSQTFTIIPERKYYVADVKVDGASVGPVTTYTFANVTAEHTITATFGTRLFAIRALAEPHGSISPSGENVQVPYGGDQAFTIAADEGYTIDYVIVDGSNEGAITSWTFTDIQKSHTIYAAFHIESCSNDNSNSQSMRSFR